LTYQLAIWGVKATAPTDPSQVRISFQDHEGKPVSGSDLSGSYDINRAVVTANIPVKFVPSLAGPDISTPKTGEFIAVLIEGLS